MWQCINDASIPSIPSMVALFFHTGLLRYFCISILLHHIPWNSSLLSCFTVFIHCVTIVWIIEMRGRLAWRSHWGGVIQQCRGGTTTYNVGKVYHFLFMDGWRYQNGWIFRKITNGLCPPPPLILGKSYCHFFLFLISYSKTPAER